MHLLLDLAGVLATFDSDARLGRLATLAGIETNEARSRLYTSGFVAAADAGEIDAAGVRNGLRDRLGLDLPDDEVDAAWASAFAPFPEVLAVIGGLSVPTGVLTNNDALLAEVLPSLLPEVFAGITSGVFFAGAIRAAKPDARAWQLVLDAWQVPPGQVVFVDDKPAYAERATELGMAGLLFTTPERLAADLAGVGIE